MDKQRAGTFIYGDFKIQPGFKQRNAEALYRQQLRVHAWRFWNGQLPENQAAMLGRVSDVHGYSTRLAGRGLSLSTRDHRSVGYRVPKEPKGQSRAGFLAGYGAFECGVGGCAVCREQGGE